MPMVTGKVYSPDDRVVNLEHLKSYDPTDQTYDCCCDFWSHIPTDNDPTRLLSRVGKWDWAFRARDCIRAKDWDWVMV